MSNKYSRLREKLQTRPIPPIGRRPQTYQDLQYWAVYMGDVYKMDLLELIHHWAQVERIPGKMRNWDTETVYRAQDHVTAIITKEKP